MIEYTKDIILKNHKGYLYFIDREHPLAKSSGVVYYHRHIASLSEGRWLSSEEVVHHKNGNSLDNSPLNLLVLSNKEHASLHVPRKYGRLEAAKCSFCGKEFKPLYHNHLFCSRKCAYLKHRKFNLSKNILIELVRTFSLLHLAEIFEVSDNAIRRRCKVLNITLPPVGYWAYSPQNRPEFWGNGSD